MHADLINEYSPKEHYIYCEINTRVLSSHMLVVLMNRFGNLDCSFKRLPPIFESQIKDLSRYRVLNQALRSENR